MNGCNGLFTTREPICPLHVHFGPCREEWFVWWTKLCSDELFSFCAAADRERDAVTERERNESIFRIRERT